MRIKDFLERRGKEHQDWGAQHSRRIEALGDQIGSYVDPARLKEALKDAEELLGYLDARKREFGETDPQGFREARQCALVLSQDLQSWLAGEERRIGLRDRFMADNILSFLDQEGPQAKAVVWAHNIHVSFAQAGLGGEDPMGFHLRKRLGSGYTSWGFVINQGTCTGWQGGELNAVRLGKAKPGSLEHGLARCGREAFALDLRSSLGHGLPPWFQRPLCMRCIGSVIPWFQGAHYVAGAPSQHFDGLVYLDRTNASKPL
jgi:erythromycin esterase-like protein